MFLTHLHADADADEDAQEPSNVKGGEGGDLSLNDILFVKLCQENKFTQAQVNSIFAAVRNGLNFNEVCKPFL